MKRSFYTLLLATALSLPAAYAMASSESAPGSASESMQGATGGSPGAVGTPMEKPRGSFGGDMGGTQMEMNTQTMDTQRSGDIGIGAAQQQARPDAQISKGQGSLALQSKLRANPDGTLGPQELTNAEVRDLQGILEQSGHYQGNIDGIWGPRTASALRRFQSENNLETSGRIDEQTLDRLTLTSEGGTPQSRSQSQPQW